MKRKAQIEPNGPLQFEIEKVMRYEYPHLSRHAERKQPISKKTLFYMKEYGPHSHIVHVIFHESLRVLLFASIISSLGGLALENIKLMFFAITPLVILLPALNDMIGDYGTIVSSRFSTMLHEGKITGKWWEQKDVREMFVQVMLIALFTSVLASGASVLASQLPGSVFDFSPSIKIIGIALLDVAFIVTILFGVSIIAGLHFYRKKEDPNNFLIPIVTSVADLGNMLLLTALVLLFF